MDIFAGAGGASLGIEQACGYGPEVAVNHAELAIRQHAANHPATIHLQTDVWEVNPWTVAAGQPIDLLWLSPDCRFHSRCSGNRIRSTRVRSLPWVAVRWAASVAPRRIILECVPELERWGKLDARGRPDPADVGQSFRRFLAALRRCGYQVAWRVLTAADYGAPTTRQRLYLLARRDGQAITWPEPTHGPGRAQPWATAGTCVDWTVPIRTVVRRARPVRPGTHARIAMGCVRHGIPHPVLVHGQPPTIAWITKHYTGVAGHGLDRPLGTITCVDHHALSQAVIEPDTGQRDTSAERWIRAGVAAWNATQGPGPDPGTLNLTVRLAGRRWRIADVRSRMWRPHELAAAQGFPGSYCFTGNQREQVRGIGNSVVPQVAAALAREMLAA